MAATEAFQLFNGGSQQQALDRLTPFVEADEGWAAALRMFMYLQQGTGSHRLALEDAERATRLGVYGAAATFANHYLGNSSANPDLVQRALMLLRAPDWGWWGSGPFDAIGMAWNLLAQGNGEAAVDLLSVQAPPAPSDWAPLVESARSHLSQLTRQADQARTQGEEVMSARESALAQIAESRDEVTTKAGQVSVLIDQLSDRTAMALYERNAEESAKEAKGAWRWGVGVLIAAAAAAIFPLLAHYTGHGPDYTTPTLLAAHLGLSGTLGALAGVLLARARTRDHSRQRSQDLATAMGTMIVHSERIVDKAAQQLFIESMGRLVLEAHLRSDTSPATTTTSVTAKDDYSGMAALVNAIRGSAQN